MSTAEQPTYMDNCRFIRTAGLWCSIGGVIAAQSLNARLRTVMIAGLVGNLLPSACR